MFIDYFENILILVIITNPAEVSSGVIASASIFTQMKGAFTTVSWIVILVLFVIWQCKKWRAKSELPIKT
jgi:hypothetical protein